MMNLSTIIGLIAGIVFLTVSIILGGKVDDYINFPSVMIVLGGTISATFVSYSFDNLKNTFKKTKEAFIMENLNLKDDIDRIIEFANTARREGLLALDGLEYNDDFLKKGIELVVDGTEAELVKDIMESEISAIEESEDVAPSVLKSMASFSPAFGMAGTLIGLINMLSSLDDMDIIGPSMATALVTTFYGVLLANLVFTPLSRKLQSASERRITRYEILLEGILSIQNGENSRIIREKLNSLVHDKKLVEETQEEQVDETADETADETNEEEVITYNEEKEQATE